MAVWAELNLAALPIGTKITSANTGNFFDLGYPSTADRLVTKAVTGGGVGVRTLPTGANSAAKDLTGHTAEGRIGWKVEFTSSTTTTTSYYEMVVLRFNTSTGFLVDTGFRHNTTTLKRFPSSRNNFAYIGQANAGNAYDLDAGEKWSFELYWVGLNATVYVWQGENTTGTPDFTWTGTMAQAPTNFMFGNDANDGVDATLYDIWVSDGERRGAGPTPGTLTFTTNMFAEQNYVRLVGKTNAASGVSLAINGNTFFATPDADGYFKVTATGLSAGTSYPWTLSVDGNSAKSGTIKTLPSTANGLNFLWGSCFDTYTSGFFSLATARNPMFIAEVGDWGYQYITGGANGNTSPTDVATVRAHRETVLAASAPQALFTTFPTSYTYSDTDGAGANSDGTTGGHATGAVQAAYRQQFAHPDLPLADCGARSWVVGRIRFIQTDETALASVKGSTDNSSKTKLGASQKAWFKDQIIAAKSSGQSVVWFGDGPWAAPALTGTNNDWSAYNTERAEIGLFIQQSGVKLVRLHGDTHSLFADNGTNNPWGGFPYMSAAPFHTTANYYGRPVTNGTWPTATTNSSRQYGVGQVVDNGETITLTLRGFSSTNSAPTEVERVTMVLDMTPPDGEAPWAVLDLSATQPGDNVTSENTNGFFNTYPAAPRWTVALTSDGQKGIQTLPTGYASGQKLLTGHTEEGRIGWKVQMVTPGANTSYFESVTLRNDTTLLYDSGLRNVSGTREAGARINFVYTGQANGKPMAPGDQWSFEMYWNGNQATTYVWDSPDSDRPPTYTWGPSTMQMPPNDFIFGPDSADGVTAILYDVWVTDGWRRGTPAPGTGGQPWAKVYVGTQAVDRVYVGSSLVWEAE